MNTSVRIGILGGGQLARMFLYAAQKLGCTVAIFDNENNSPAGKIIPYHTIGSIENHSLLKKFASECEVVTLENEFIDYHHLLFLEKQGIKVFPSSHTIKLVQDKFLQKQTLQKYGIPVGTFLDVNYVKDFQRISQELGLPFILKSRKMGYDGYGNATVDNKKSFHQACQKLSSRHSLLLAEKFVDFSMELAVMVVRTKKETKVYPVVETIQENHICKIVLASAKISLYKKKLAQEIAVAAIESVKGYGLFGVEMFFTKDENILVNELAPRPHNSGHYTIEACYTSQFENHIRAILDLPLGSTEMVLPSAVMVNLLGKKNPKNILQNYKNLFGFDDKIHLHLYGKEHSRIGRKMGHITLVGRNQKELLQKALKIEKKIFV